MSRVQSYILWDRTAIHAPECHSLSSSLEADFTIVGGGLCGIRTALALAEQGAKVIVLESGRLGQGASGRSGGQCNPVWRATPAQLAQRLGDACADRLVSTTLQAANALFTDISRYGIDCDAVQNGWLQAAHSAQARSNLQKLGTAWQAAGAQISMLDAQAVEDNSGTSEYDFALLHHTGGHVQPLSLTRGFAIAAQHRGARLFENSPVVSITPASTQWQIRTPNGQVISDQIILTTNAYTDSIWPHLEQSVIPIVSILLATEPLHKALDATVLPNSVTLADTRRAIYYTRKDRQGRLLFGCVGSGDKVNTLGAGKHLILGLRRIFPQLGTTRIETCWSGRIAMTPDLMPHLFELDRGVLAGLGFSGRGIAMTSVMAKALADKAMGADSGSLPFPVTGLKRIAWHGAKKQIAPLMTPLMRVRDRLDRRT